MGGLDWGSSSRAKWDTLAMAPGVPNPRSRSPDRPPGGLMPGTELRASGPRSRIGPQRGRLRAAAAAFQATAGSPAGESSDARAAWLAAVSRALTGLGAAWREDVGFTEAPCGT